MRRCFLWEATRDDTLKQCDNVFEAADFWKKPFPLERNNRCSWKVLTVCTQFSKFIVFVMESKTI